MDSRVLIVAAVAFLVLGYKAYGKFVARTLGLDPSRKTPAYEKYDGVDYVPARHWLVLFGHHFSSICAAGPIVGPALAVAYWGWAPSVFWILLGGVLLGAVADFSSLVISVRHGGVSISEVTGHVVSRRARTLFSVFILIALVLVLAVFAVLTAGTFEQAPEIVLPSWGILPVAILTGLLLYRGGESRGGESRGGRGRLAVVTVAGLAIVGALLAAGHRMPMELPAFGALTPQLGWIAILFGYCAFASVLPVQSLLQPRDYLSAYVLFATIVIGLAGTLWTGPALPSSAYHGFQPAEWPIAGPLWPMLFVTVACGAISGFHSVVSSGTTCKQLASEGHACRIGYGAMLVESTVAILVVIAVAAGLSAERHAELLRAPGGAITAFGEGYGAVVFPFLGDYGPTFAIMALNFFILTTLDTATRLGRYLVEELTGWTNRYLPTFLVVTASAILAMTGQWRALWPAFGASNQLLGALTLLVVACWLLQRGASSLIALVPGMLMLLTTVGALLWQIKGSLERAGGPDYFLAGLCAVLVALAAAVFWEVRGFWGSFRGRSAPGGVSARDRGAS